MAATAWRWVLGLVLWTLLVWVSRIRNVWDDDSLDTTGQWVRTGVALVFCVLALAVAAGLRRWRARTPTRVDRRVLTVTVVWTVAFWLVRGVGIILDDHDLGFTLVHTVLMVVSIALALVVQRVTTVRSPTEPPVPVG